MTTAVTTNSTPVDVMGKEFAVGQTVCRPVPMNGAGSCGLEIREVSKIVNGKVYLTGSNTPIKFSTRLVIVG